jgi:hypothetical protein
MVGIGLSPQRFEQRDLPLAQLKPFRYWQRVRPRCAGEHDAYRRLANRWLAVLWKLWQSGEPYDETYHLRQRRLRSQPRA